MNDFVLPELLQNLRNLLQASVQLEKPFVEDGFHAGSFPFFAPSMSIAHFLTEPFSTVTNELF